jgi:hypothetical protein
MQQRLPFGQQNPPTVQQNWFSVPQHVWPVGQQVSLQQWEPTGQQVPPQHTASAAQHVSPQHLPADAAQQVSPQLNTAWAQQVSPAHPLAGGWHGVPPQWSTGSAQTPLKQLLEQQSLSCAQAAPLSLPQLWFGQQCVPAEQTAQIWALWPQALLAVPAKHKPGWPGPFSQHPFGEPV